jgi:hypothetical protein
MGSRPWLQICAAMVRECDSIDIAVHLGRSVAAMRLVCPDSGVCVKKHYTQQVFNQTIITFNRSIDNVYRAVTGHLPSFAHCRPVVRVTGPGQIGIIVHVDRMASP